MSFYDPDNIQLGERLRSVKPRIGSPVHYVSYGTPGGEFESTCRAAIVTEIGAWVDRHVEQLTTPYVRQVTQEWEEFRLSICVLNPTGEFFNKASPDFGQRLDGKTNSCTGLDYRGGTWHFPYMSITCDHCEDVPEWYDMEQCPRCGAKATK